MEHNRRYTQQRVLTILRHMQAIKAVRLQPRRTVIVRQGMHILQTTIRVTRDPGINYYNTRGVISFRNATFNRLRTDYLGVRSLSIQHASNNRRCHINNRTRSNFDQLNRPQLTVI